MTYRAAVKQLGISWEDFEKAYILPALQGVGEMTFDNVIR